MQAAQDEAVRYQLLTKLMGLIMKHRYFILTAAIAAALASTPNILLAQSTASGNVTLPGISIAEAPRVTQAVTNSNLATLPKTHLAFLGQATSSKPLTGAVMMKHLQLVLRPSAKRTAAMETLIAEQHNPKSAKFQKWLTPQEFGAAFGAVDNDVAAVTAWLTAQGFTVNSVYPNKTQIDFSGTVAQVNRSFHTQEAIYKIGKENHLANASDISVPAALEPVVAGVMGLSDYHPKAFIEKPHLAQWSASKKGFVPQTAAVANAGKVIGQAININSAERGLVPNDLATMYGIRTLRSNGVTGKGVTIAVVEDGDMVPSDWTNFVSVFNLGQYGGTFSEVNPAPISGPNNCIDPDVQDYGESVETILDAEWSTAIAPGANIEVATCSDYTGYYSGYATTNFFGGVFIAATNLINASTRPDVISASYGYGEYFTGATSEAAIDLMWAQADAEGISVFVSTGDSGSNPSFNGGVISDFQHNPTIDVNAFATSPHVTAVGGTDTADILDGTTSKYFASTPSAVGGSALSYVPEIPWNQSCGNGVAAKAFGFNSAEAFCLNLLKNDPVGYYITSEAGSGGPSSVDAKPAWQREVYGAAPDQSRDIPDVSLFAGSYGGYTSVILCDTAVYPCTPGFTQSTPTLLEGGTSLSSPMFAGIQALMDQGLAARGLPTDQGNAAPTLYALAAKEYGGASGPTPASLATCNADNGATGTADCVFHNVTRGSNSTNCVQETSTVYESYTTNYCYYYAAVQETDQPGVDTGTAYAGLTTTDATPTSYGPSNKAFGARPGWSFTSGLGSVDAKNLLIAWRAFDNAPPADAP